MLLPDAVKVGVTLGIGLPWASLRLSTAVMTLPLLAIWLFGLSARLVVVLLAAPGTNCTIAVTLSPDPNDAVIISDCA